LSVCVVLGRVMWSLEIELLVTSRRGETITSASVSPLLPREFSA